MWPNCFRYFFVTLVLLGMRGEALPIGRKERSSNEDIIAGVDFLSVFMRNAEERYYPDYTKEKSPFDILDKTYQEDFETTSKRPRFSISTKPTTTEPTTTTKKPKLSIPTLPTIRKVEVTTTTEVPIELRTSPPPITNSDVYKYIKSKSGKEELKKEETQKDDSAKEEYRKQDTFTEISVEVSTEKSKPNSKNAVSHIEPSAIISHSTKDELSIEEEEPLTMDATEINEKIEPKPETQSKRSNHDEVNYQFDISRNNRLSPNKARSISYSAVDQMPKEEEKKNWEQEYPRKNRTESVAETKEYFVTSKYEPETQQPWSQQSQRSIYHTTEKVWGTSEKIWGVQQTTPKVWGVQQTTPKVWGVQQTTPKVWGVQQTTPKVWGSTEKIWGVQQTTPKVWGVQQEPYNPPKPKNFPNNQVYSQAEENYEIDESVSVLTQGRAHGVQKEDKPLQIKVGAPIKGNDNQKVGYVVEGRNYKKYRVEERTSDGFIVGEYGVVSNNDGSLRGVRYTADGTINPSVIYDALMKFLSL